MQYPGCAADPAITAAMRESWAERDAVPHQIGNAGSLRVLSQYLEMQMRCSEYNATTGSKPQESEQTGDPKICKPAGHS